MGRRRAAQRSRNRRRLGAATIAAAVWSGHRYAEELDEPQAPGPVPYLREVTELAQEPVIQLPITSVEPVRSRSTHDDHRRSPCAKAVADVAEQRRHRRDTARR